VAQTLYVEYHLRSFNIEVVVTDSVASISCSGIAVLTSARRLSKMAESKPGPNSAPSGLTTPGLRKNGMLAPTL